MDDVASEAVASAVTEDEIMDNELAEDELDLGNQLEREAQKIVEDDDKTVGSKPADAETSEEEEEESQSLSARETRLIAQNEQLQAEIRGMKSSTKAQEEEEEDVPLDKIPYDAGSIGEEFEGLRPALEANGKFLISQVRATEKKTMSHLKEIVSHMGELEAEVMRMRHKIEPDEEREIVAYANKNGLEYGTRKELSRLIKTYRDDKELRELRREKAERAVAGKNAKPERKANTRTRSTSRQVEEDLQEAMGDKYNHSWDKAVKKTLGDLRGGGGILGDRGL